MYSDPDGWDALMSKLCVVITDYLLEQASAGVDALQLFDSWAGAVGRLDYERYVRPYTSRVLEAVAGSGLPVISFSTGTSGYLASVAQAGGDVVGVDFRLPLDAAWDQVGFDRAIMGNLDPVLLQAPWETLKSGSEDVLNRAGGRPGHIFNLGHGILPETPTDNVRRLVDFVHERTAVARSL